MQLTLALSGSFAMNRLALASLLSLSLGCAAPPVDRRCPAVYSAVSVVSRDENPGTVDLVFVIDSAPSAAEHLSRLFEVVQELIDPPCVSRSMPGGGAQHRCDPNNPDDVRASAPIASLRVGVVSADLGARGSGLRACETPRGLDGRIGPRVTATLLRSPSSLTAAAGSLAPGSSEANCGDLPSFLSFCGTIRGCRREAELGVTSTRDVGLTRQQFACHTAAAQERCAISQPLEALWRALVEHGAAQPPGGPGLNAGFLRPDALLAIVVMTTGDDQSARDCSRDAGFSATRSATCIDGTSAFSPTSTQWSHSDVERRFYPETLDSPLDPMWSIDRYLPNDPSPTGLGLRWNRDLPSLKPGHPERILFSAITGAPVNIPWGGRDREPIDWRALARSTVPRFDDRCGHIAAVCQRETTEPPSSACRSDASIALPARRMVELARRFDEAPLCNGAPCRNGAVDSVCADRFANTIQLIRDRTTPRIPGCPQYTFVPDRGPDGLERISCELHEILPPGQTCDATRGRRPLAGLDGVFTEDGMLRAVCAIDQIATYPADAGARAGEAASDAPGWYYDRSLERDAPSCAQHISYTGGARPAPNAMLRLECTQRLYDVPCGS